MADFNLALEVNPEYTEAYYNRGFVYLGQGKLDQAVSDYSKAIAINPGYAVFYSNRAEAYFLKKEYGLSWEDARKAESLGYSVNPDFLKELRKALGKEE